MAEKVSILRFKRKPTIDCPHSLVVQAKRAKLDEGVDSTQHVIFKYAGQISDDNSSIELALKEVMQKDSKRKRLSSLSGNLKNCSAASSSAETKPNFTSMSVSKKRKINEGIEVIDIDDTPPVSCPTDESLLTCNGLKMMRNKRTVSENTSNYTSEGDNLYDLYYHCWTENSDLPSTERTFFDPLDVLYVAPYADDFSLDPDDDKLEKLEDSDSNDEDHWKNDYPDSPDSTSSCDTASSEDSFSKRQHGYRQRKWDREAVYFEDNTRYLTHSFLHDDPTDFFERYSDHVQSDNSLTD